MSMCNKLFCVVIGSSQCGEVELRGYVLGKVRPKIASLGSLAVGIIGVMGQNFSGRERTQHSPLSPPGHKQELDSC